MFIDQKAQQISLALIRISVQIRRSDLRSRLERMAFQILEDVAVKDFEAVLEDTEVIKSLVSIGKLVFQIEPINSKIILSEVDNFNSAIRQISGIESGSLEVANIFSTPSSMVTESSIKNSELDQDFNFSGNHNGNGHNDNNGNGNGNGINATIRQSAIIDKIRQSGKIALKDLLAEFPEVSERTIRYDLQKLCLSGNLERIGNGGPATYYVSKT